VTPTFQQHLDAAPLTRYQWRLWFLAAMGPLLDGFDFFCVAVALPLIVHEFHLTPAAAGMVAVAALAGAMVGAVTLGRLTDRYGRRRLFLVNFVLFVVFAAGAALAWNLASLVVCRFLLGVGIGADYPIGASYIAEILPTRVRARFLIGAKMFLTLGSILGVLVGLLILRCDPTSSAWRWMLAAGVIPAVIVLAVRSGLPESPRWLIQNRQFDRASEIATKLSGSPIRLDVSSVSTPAAQMSYSQLFSTRYRRRTVLTAVPWLLQDFSTYALKIFTPTIIASLAMGGHGNYIAADIGATEKTLLVEFPLLVGGGIALVLVTRISRIRLQSRGFLTMAIALMIAGASTFAAPGSRAQLVCILLGLMLFNLAAATGPESTAYLLSAEAFPTQIRGAGAGLAAGAAKAGALMGTFLLPIMIAHIGIPAVLAVMATTCVAAAVITNAFAVDTSAALDMTD